MCVLVKLSLQLWYLLLLISCSASVTSDCDVVRGKMGIKQEQTTFPDTPGPSRASGEDGCADAGVTDAKRMDHVLEVGAPAWTGGCPGTPSPWEHSPFSSSLGLEIVP